MTVLHVVFTISVLFLAGAILWRWHRIRRKRKVKAFLSSLPETADAGISPLINHSITICCHTVQQAIDTIIRGNRIDSCRVYRVFEIEYEKFDHYHKTLANPYAPENIYLLYLWEATVKLAESGRKMVINPEYDCTTEEIYKLIFWKNNISKSVECLEIPGDLPQLAVLDMAEAFRVNKNILSTDIREYTALMRHNDY